MPYGYTVVQHANYGIAGNPQFARGLQSYPVETLDQLRAVETLGGVVFATYGQAETYAEKQAYPPDYGGLVPAAPGRFADATLGGLRIYIPAS